MSIKTISLITVQLIFTLNGVCFQTPTPQQQPSASAVGSMVVQSRNAGAINGSNNVSSQSASANIATKIPYVTEIYARKIDSFKKHKIAHPNDLIVVTISNPKAFMDQRPDDNSKIVLVADGVELKGITSNRLYKIRKEDFHPTDTTMSIPFFLVRDTTTKPAWDHLYKFADSWIDNEVKVQITVEWENMLPVKILPELANKPKTTEVIIVLYERATFWLLVILYVILIIGLSFLVVETDILREGRNGAYSLAQTQLAFWTILILGGFIYSLLLTDIPATLNTSILTLLGISIGTNGLSSYIDYFNKRNNVFVPKPQSLGFLRDILGDGSSINMQRFQIVAWTAVLGVYYSIYTVKHKTMPIIPDVLLTLSGMSSLTFVAAKPTETPPKPPVNPNPNPGPNPNLNPGPNANPNPNLNI